MITCAIIAHGARGSFDSSRRTLLDIHRYGYMLPCERPNEGITEHATLRLLTTLHSHPPDRHAHPACSPPAPLSQIFLFTRWAHPGVCSLAGRLHFAFSRLSILPASV